MSAVGGHRLQGIADQHEVAAHERRIQAKAQLLMADSGWWMETLAGINAVSTAVEEQMPRMMANMDDACRQQTRPEVGHYAVQGILAALHIIQTQAKLRARECAEEEIDG